ncbi:unnamed protein product [Durusdinium trenchii]|uniref:Uncharacterized protein n=1 Tax=Durusdinium trenchii TaxID=1381693 RepID=A0ABP0RPU5_9DINO
MERPTAAELLGFGGSTVRAVRALRGSSASPKAKEPNEAKVPWRSHWNAKAESEKRYVRSTGSGKLGTAPISEVWRSEALPHRSRSSGRSRRTSPLRAQDKVPLAPDRDREVLSLPVLADLLLDAAKKGDTLQVEGIFDHADFEDQSVRALLAARDVDDQTPLHRAARHGHLEVCDLLLRRRADVLATEGHGASPLMLSSLNGHEEVARLLLQHKAQGRQSDMKGRPAARVLRPLAAPCGLCSSC